MVRFDVEFIFCCPCSLFVVHDSMFLNYSNDFVDFCKQMIPGRNFEHEMCTNYRPVILTCFAHLSETMYCDVRVCLHYHRRTFLTAPC